ncbi:MAG: vitamin B12-dependent ribonucleotide reductase [Exilispira sp.]
MLNLSDNAKVILEKRYLLKDKEGNPVETIEGLFERVARYIASAEKIYNPDANIEEYEKIFYDLMTSLDFLPNSPTLMNAGTDIGQLSACFVLPVGDSIDEIFDAVKYAAIIHKTGGGTGFSFSRLRPRNDIVKSTAGISSGPVSFMEVFDAATNAIKQGGKRRGANMGILSVHHPDIVEFITYKNDLTKLTNFNISVALTDKFLDAVEKDKEYDLINPRTKKVVRKESARKIFNLIVESAWKTGEPGIIFIDEINRKNPTPLIGEIESTNPCGEQPLLPYESCNLGSINLNNILVEKNNFYEIDWNKLEKITRLSIRFLDNVIDKNNYPLPQIEKMTKGNRKIGLGVMGFADMLYKLNIPYNSDKAVETAEMLMNKIHEYSISASQELAEERGVFPNWEKSIYKEKNLKIRNSTVTTIAPTGTISLIAEASSGIEPVFALAYSRKAMDSNILKYFHPYFQKILSKLPEINNKIIDKIIENGSLKNIESIPENIKSIFVTAHDIDPIWHIKIQSAFQKYTDNAVSKTINFPSTATIEDVANSYKLAHKLGCKGITIYRDKSREGILHAGISEKDQSIEGKDKTIKIDEKSKKPRKRPLTTVGKTIRIETGCGHLYVTINEDEYGLVELFATMGKAGGCASSQIEAISRLISLALRSHIDPNSIIKQLKGIRCPNPTIYPSENGKTLSCSDGIAKAIEIYLNEKNSLFESESITNFNLSVENRINLEKKIKLKKDENHDKNEIEKNLDEDIKRKKEVAGICPDCGGVLVQEEGCITCHDCGYSKCG